MTRKDYIKIADAIAEAKIRALTECSIIEPHLELNLVTAEIIDVLKGDNPRFDVDRFNSRIEKRFRPYNKGESHE